MHIEEAVEKFHAHRVGSEWRARCPAHRGDGHSLSLREGDLGILVYCWSQGCSIDQICRAAGIGVGELFYEPAKGLAIHKARRESLRAIGDGWWKDKKTGALWVAANDVVRRVRADAERARAKGHALGEVEGWGWLELAARLETEAERLGSELDAAAE